MPVITDPDGAAIAYGWSEGTEYALDVPGVAVFRFGSESPEIQAIPSPAGSGRAVTDAYETIALPLALQVRGFEALHASAVCLSGGVVAFCAPSETGKTTTAYALSRRGHDLWADDVVVLEVNSDGAVRTHPLPFYPNIRPETRELFGEAPAQVAENRHATPVSLAAIVVLERSDARASVLELNRLGPPDALRALEPHAFRFNLGDPQLKRRTMQNYLAMAAHVPVMRARFAPSLERLDSLLDELEAALTEVAG
jgi:hypothetical protein